MTRTVKAGQRYREYKNGRSTFKVVKVSGQKAHTSNGTIIDRSRLAGSKHYKLLG